MPWHYAYTNQAGGLTYSEQQDNATMIYGKLTSYGWTLEAIAGCLGNAQGESGINPGQVQIGFPLTGPEGGYGLWQWTPQTKYRDWAAQEGYSIFDGDKQVEFLQMNTLLDGSHQYAPSTQYPISWEEYQKSTETPEYLCAVFMRNFERITDDTLPTRQRYARQWYDYLGGITPPEPGTWDSKLPIWAYRNIKIVVHRARPIIRR